MTDLKILNFTKGVRRPPICQESIVNRIKLNTFLIKKLMESTQCRYLSF